MRLIDADKMAVNELTAFIFAQAMTTDAANRDINSIVHEKIQRLIADTPTAECDAVEQCPECDNAMTKYEILKWLKRMNLAFGGETAYTLESGHAVHYTSIIADISAAVSKMETPPMTCKDCPYFEPVWGDELLGRCTQAKACFENRYVWDYCSNSRITETAEPQPDSIQFRTVDDLGRICLPKDIRDKLGLKPGTECAVYSTDELTSEQIIVIRRK